MDSNSKSLLAIFKRIIFQGLEKVDISKPEQRKRVYLAALSSLEKAHQKNEVHSVEQKSAQRRELENLIFEVENQISKLGTQQDSGIPEPSINEPDFDSSHALDQSPAFEELSEPSTQKISLLQKFGMQKKKLILLFSGLVAIVLTAVIYFNSIERNTTGGLELPYSLNVNEALLKSIRTKGSITTELSGGLKDGILVEADFKNSEEPNRLDLILRGDIAKKINAIEEPILVTFHIEKISKEDLELNFLVRAVGKAVRKKVEILDQKLNEYFVVTSVEQAGAPKTNVLIRLQIDAGAKKTEEKGQLIIKKIVFSKI